jgi:hypothetical protein
MSKEHKNKRDAKKKSALSPKEKKAAKLAKKIIRRMSWGIDWDFFQLIRI